MMNRLLQKIIDDEKGVNPIRLTPSLVEHRGLDPPGLQSMIQFAE